MRILFFQWEINGRPKARCTSYLAAKLARCQMLAQLGAGVPLLSAAFIAALQMIRITAPARFLPDGNDRTCGYDRRYAQQQGKGKTAGIFHDVDPR